MALETFNPPVPPSPGTETETTLKLKTAQFGDGYTQETRDGLNHMRLKAELRWEVLLPADAATIETFFRNHGGDTPFYYALAHDTTRKWTCKVWKRTRDTPNSMTATLEESFSLLT